MAIVSDIGIPGFSQQGILQPKLSNRWRITFSGIGVGTESQPLSVQALSFQRPSISLEQIELNRYNSRAWIASRYNFEETQLVFEDDTGGTASKILQDQFSKQQWLIGAEGPYLQAAPSGSAYKFQMTGELLDGGDSTNLLESWQYQGCWITKIDYKEMSYTAINAMQLAVSVRFDMVNQIISGVSRGDGMGAGTV